MAYCQSGILTYIIGKAVTPIIPDMASDDSLYHNDLFEKWKRNSPALAVLESVTYRDNFVLAIKAARDSDMAWGNTEMLQYHIV